MRFFRSTWLERVLLFLLPVLLNVGPIVIIEQPVNEKDGSVIQVARFQDKVSSSLRQLQIKYGFDVVYISLVPVIRQILSGDYIEGTSFDPISPDLRNYPDRGPPHRSAVLQLSIEQSGNSVPRNSPTHTELSDRRVSASSRTLEE